ncbi:MAG: hypothetical protein NVSMB29_19150 [Candidatus Dormibacteria bacterium]
MSERRSLTSRLSRPFTALLLFGAVGMVAMVVVFSVARGAAARPLPIPVTQVHAVPANQAAAPAASAAPVATIPPTAPPATNTAGGGSGDD